MITVLIETQKKTQTHRGEGGVKVKAEVGVMWVQGEECEVAGSQLKLGEKPGTDSSSDPPEGSNAASTLTSDSWPPDL